MNIAVIGATGLVGRAILKLLDEKNLCFDNLYLYASKKSDGVKFKVLNKEYTVKPLTPNILNEKLHLAFLAAGSEVSLHYARKLAQKGVYVIDNSSNFRRDAHIPLIAAGVNDNLIRTGGEFFKSKLIANPNCSTLILVPTVFPLLKLRPKKIVVTTLQAVSGAGYNGILDLSRGEKNLPPQKFDKKIYGNLLPQIGIIEDNLFSTEENKIMFETCKILKKDIEILATCIRVPVKNCHSESIYIEFEKPFDLQNVKSLLSTEGITYYPDYPTPIDADGQNNILIGRIRKGLTNNSLKYWVVGDNLLQGAALNAVRIAKILQKSSIIDL